MFVVVTLYGEWNELLQQIHHVLFMVSGIKTVDKCNLFFQLLNLIGVFYYFNSILNPILYTILSKRFRRGFDDMYSKCNTQVKTGLITTKYVEH